jgi:hypothetical protein
MTAGRWAFTAIMTAAVLGLGLSGPDDDATARLTRPTSVALDFHDRTVAEVVKAIGDRSGKRVAAHGAMAKSAAGVFRIGGPADMSWRDRTVTLESTGPVPFWEAIDRLSVASRLAYRLGDFSESTGVVFEGDGDAPGPACYAGPFRVGLLGVHEHHDVVLVRGPWVWFYPSGVPAPADASDLASAPKDGGPLYAELNLAAEPGLVCRRDGPLNGLEAVDEAGRALLAPAREDMQQSFHAFAPVSGGITPIVRVPLRRVERGGASKSIRRLRGVIPVEVAALKPEPAVVIRLGDAEGRIFRGGGAVFTVETDRTDSDGRMKLALSCRLSGEEEPAVREARLAALRTYQLRVVDARGAAVHFASTSSGGDGRGTLSFSYEYVPGQPPLSEPPAEFRYYDLDRAAWRVPFEFHDIPLP